MKLVLFDDYKPGALKGDGVVDLSGVVESARNGQETMEGIINNWDSLKPKLEAAVAQGAVIPLSSVRLRAPLPRPGKVMAMSANYQEHAGREVPIEVFLESPESILDPGGTVVLPKAEFPICHHEAELALVIGRKAKDVTAGQAFNYIFGYVAAVDVSVRNLNRQGARIGKSFDTFTPIGPCIATKDEIANPDKVHVQLRVDGKVRHDYNTDDMAHKIPEIMEYTSMIMTLNPGDIILCGTNHEGLGPLQEGDNAEMEIEGIGKFPFKVQDPLKRRWYHSTDVEAERQGIKPRQPLA